MGKEIQNADGSDEPHGKLAGIPTSTASGEFANQCVVCNRTFKERHIIREHRQYICMQQSDASQEQENSHQYQADQELEQDEEHIEPKEK